MDTLYCKLHHTFNNVKAPMEVYNFENEKNWFSIHYHQSSHYLPYCDICSGYYMIIWDLVGFYKVFIILFMFSVQYKFYISSMWQKANYRIDPADTRQIYNQPQQIFTHFLFPHNKLSQVNTLSETLTLQLTAPTIKAIK